MPWNPFASKPKDIELPAEGERDTRLPPAKTTPLDTLKTSLETWRKINTGAALEGLKDGK